MRLIILGPPGSGKGTQSDIIKEKMELKKLSTGDLLRNEIKKQSSVGLKAKQFMDKGELVPDSVMIDILEIYIDKFENENKGYILDGFPRTKPQAKALMKMLEKKNAPLTAAILVDVTEDELIKRLTSRWTCKECGAIYSFPNGLPKGEKCSKCGGELYQRSDDKKKTIVNRLKVYKKKTEPLIEYFQKDNLLLKVSGEGKIKEIAEKIIKLLEEK
ncbi:MAG: adenylate kinase [Candidatus Marinimicrobia bacterium]|nr:adenylate kinase [Candidatus Neomarinimicrobiota bacterium]